MTAPHEPGHMTHATPQEGAGHRHGHRLMMIACCVPMLVIAVALVATGVASPGFLIVAIGCTVMMAVMMAGMGHGTGHQG